MKVIFKEPGKRCEYRDIELSLSALQEAQGPDKGKTAKGRKVEVDRL